jgi:hypothetical protein
LIVTLEQLELALSDYRRWLKEREALLEHLVSAINAPPVQDSEDGMTAVDVKVNDEIVTAAYGNDSDYAAAIKYVTEQRSGRNGAMTDPRIARDHAILAAIGALHPGEPVLPECSGPERSNYLNDQNYEADRAWWEESGGPCHHCEACGAAYDLRRGMEDEFHIRKSMLVFALLAGPVGPTGPMGMPR